MFQQDSLDFSDFGLAAKFHTLVTSAV